MPARRPAAPARTRGLDLITSAVLLAAVGTAAAALSSILADVQWWFVVMLVAALVLGAGAAVRAFARRRAWGSVGAALAAICSLTLLFVPGTALLGIVPTPETLRALTELQAKGTASIAAQAVPANADQGIVYLLCLGVAVICVVLDLLALTLRQPALTGIPLLVLLLVPSLIDPVLDDGLFFALTAAAFVGLLLVRSRPAGRAAGVTVAAAAVLAALIVPLGLPAVAPSAPSGNAERGPATGVNPIINLGDDLRRGSASLALSYTTSESRGVYLRLTALDDFTGESWSPSSTKVIDGNDVAAIGAAPGLGPAVRTTPSTTGIEVGGILSRWLPVPYAATSIDGLDGDWSWEPDALSIRTENSNARGQQYVVQSVTIQPSIEQLIAAGTTVDPGLERYLEVPDDLPPIVAKTALEVVGAAATNYDKALALQDYFRGGDFTYSEEAPVENDYDGSGASVLGAFLEAKSGYCVHFSSAMASMARTLGIPARVVVGFTPGSPAKDAGDSDTEFRVTTHDLHAWPELYFSGVGWVRFEPTPGRGFTPEFAPLAADDPATPDVDESVPAPVATAPVPTSTPTALPGEVDQPETAPESGPDAPSRTISGLWSVLVALVALLLAPAVVRGIRRGRRMADTSRGSAAAAWQELRDTADDLGLATSPTRTPRQLADDLAPHLDAPGAAALSRLRIALETEAFAGQAGAPDPRDVTAVSRSLRRSAGPWRALRSLLLPRSLFARWLPEPARLE